MKGMTMKRMALALSLVVLGLGGAAGSARADYAVIRFNSGFCRVWTDTAYGPQDGHFLWFRHYAHGHYHRYYRFPTWNAAVNGLHRAAHEGRCRYWW